MQNWKTCRAHGIKHSAAIASPQYEGLYYNAIHNVISTTKSLASYTYTPTKKKRKSLVSM